MGRAFATGQTQLRGYDCRCADVPTKKVYECHKVEGESTCGKTPVGEIFWPNHCGIALVLQPTVREREIHVFTHHL